MSNSSELKQSVIVLRHQIDYLGDENYENVDCNEHGGNCCASGYCCDQAKHGS